MIGEMKRRKKTMTIPDTILEQLGGNKFLAMTGSIALTNGDDLMIKLCRKVKKLKWLTIHLNGLDLYDLTFTEDMGKVVKIIKNVYADQLQEIFTDVTGLDTKLCERVWG